ncbi:phosphate ABC transporter permease subunit PstC [Candidatus Bathyarchaeota archaeon]|nr:phosphate ABC transporter permease subunit PstC [Candidatus Bathyarchaeota archaeon]
MTQHEKSQNFLSKIKTNHKKRFSGDSVFRTIILLIACNIFIILGLIIFKITQGAWLSIQTYGIKFLWGTTWQPFPPEPTAPPSFGALPLVWGTLTTSAIALLLGVPISLGIALALSEFTPKSFNYVISFFVELLAAIPSVIYGLWGIFILIPFLQNNVYPHLQATLGFLPFFQGTIRGSSVLTGGIVLAIMIIPTVSAISRDVFAAVPNSQREAIIALGATRWEKARIVMSYGRSGVIGAIMLGLGRAIGETMAITMVIGNSFNMFTSLFEPGSTLASIIANEFTEASSPPVYISALMEVGLILFALAIAVNASARLVIWRSMRKTKEAEML